MMVPTSLCSFQGLRPNSRQRGMEWNGFAPR